MKTSQKYLLSALATAVVVAGLSIGSLGFAQTVTPVTCTASSASVNTNQAVILTASGGDGVNYSWSGANLTTTNPSGAQFAVSFPNTGSYPVTVTSGGSSATCTVNVAATATSGTLICSPATQTVTLGQTASVSATGGDGVNYSWSAPDLTISNPSGSGFSANYASAGLHTLTVASNGSTATCAINVLPISTITPPVTTPSLPDTGGGYGK